MSLRAQPPLPPIPDDTARIARAAFRRGNPYVLLRDRLGAMFADAVRGRIDWKHLLALELADAGFDHSVLCGFRGRLLEHGATERLLARVLETAREAALLGAVSVNVVAALVS